MDTYKITTFHVGTITRKRSNMIEGADSELIDFPLLVFLLEGKDKNVLIDTGGTAPDGVRWMPYRRAENETIEALLAERGLTPDDINAVFFTHLHWDHCGDNASFKNAALYVQRLEYDFIAEQDRIGYDRELVLQSDYTFLDGDTENVLPGISVILTPGHSVGSQSILVNTEEGSVVFSGDMIPTYENIRLNVPNGGNYDRDVIMNSMNRVISLGYKIYPGHAM